MRELGSHFAVPQQNEDSDSRSYDSLLKEEREGGPRHGPQFLSKLAFIAGVGHGELGASAAILPNRSRRLEDYWIAQRTQIDCVHIAGFCNHTLIRHCNAQSRCFV